MELWVLCEGVLARKSLFFFLVFSSHSLSPKRRNVPSFCSRYPSKLYNSFLPSYLTLYSYSQYTMGSSCYCQSRSGLEIRLGAILTRVGPVVQFPYVLIPEVLRVDLYVPGLLWESNESHMRNDFGNSCQNSSNDLICILKKNIQPPSYGLQNTR